MSGNEIQRVAIYYRVSSEQQVEADTIENQRQFFPEYVKRKGWEIVAEFEDCGRSGTSVEGRPHFKEMLKRVRAGDYDAVVVRHSDRLTRTEDLEEWGLIMGAFQKSGTRIASPYEGVTDLAQLTGQVMEFIKGRMSSEKIGNEMKESGKQRKKGLSRGYTLNPVACAMATRFRVVEGGESPLEWCSIKMKFSWLKRQIG